jgi:hypothetical protein
MPTEYELGLLIGLLIGEGHFGGDGRQPQITLRMHIRHETMFHWLERTFPGGRLYGPYDHGGRQYYQWMARGAYLRDELLPLIESRITPDLDAYAHERVVQMVSRYRPQLANRSTDRSISAPEAESESASSPPDSPSGVEGGSTGQPPRAETPGSPSSDQSLISRAEFIFSRMRNSDSEGVAGSE